MIKYSILIFFVCISHVLLNAQITTSFTFSPDHACSGTQIQFRSTVTGGNSSNYLYSWDFGDGLNSSVANPFHIFNAVGCNEQLFNVVLTITDTTNGANFSNSSSNIVNVKCKPNPQFIDSHNDPDFSNCDNDPTQANADFIITLQNNTSNSACISTYTINWGDGSSLVTGLTNNSFPLDYTYTKLGAFNLTITAYGTNGCIGVTTYVVKNQSNPAVGLSTEGSTQGCAPRTYSFNLFKDELNSPGTTYLWDFGDNSPNVIWTKDSVLVNKGIISHTFMTSSCGNSNKEFVITVTASNSCSSTSATVGGIKIWSSPSANFNLNPTQGCVNTTQFCFPNTTVPGAYGSSCNTTTTYQWDFGNGQTSTNPVAPCQTYSTAGTYSISLIASNGCGSSTITKQISVQIPPAAIAVADKNTGCVPFNVHFTNNSNGSNNQYTWSVSPTLGWSFANGTNKNSQNPELQFTNVGTYTVSLNVVNACGSDKISFTITANGIPSILIPTITDDCLPFTYIGNALYTNNGSNITSYLWSVSQTSGWNFVPPSNSGSQNPTILFSQAGTYQNTIQATNGCGTGSRTSNQFNVFPLVQVAAGNDTTICINSGSSQLKGNPTGGTWSGTNINSSGVFSPVAAGSFTLTYTRGTGNCQTKDEVIVTVAPRPVVYAGTDITKCINNGLLTLTGSPLGGTWSGTGITNSITGTFDPLISGPGAFTISYTYTDATTKCSNSDNTLITVFPIPLVVANDVTLCNQPIPVQLTATPAGGVWSGSYVSSTGLFIPNGIGNFNLVYTYTDSKGCSNADPMTVSVIEPTLVSAGNDTLVCINSGSFQLKGNPTGGTWSGTNINSSGVFSPIIPGPFMLTYTRGTGNCQTKDDVIVTVAPRPVVDAGSNIAKCINSGLLTLTGSPLGGTWSGAGITNSITGTLDPLISGPGSFTISYTYTDATTKCSNSDNTLITVYDITPVIVNNVQVCNQPVAEQLTGIPEGGTWSGPNVTPDGMFTPNGIGDFILFYKYTNGNNCSNSVPMTVTVVSPDNTINAGNDTAICSYESLKLSGFPIGGTWSGTGITPEGFFNPGNAGNYWLVYSIGNGSCKVTDSIFVKVGVKPKADFRTKNVCFGDTTFFIDQSQSAGVNIASWQWKFGDGTISGIPNPSHKYLYPRSYFPLLLVTNQDGCIDSITKPVEVMILPKPGFSFVIPTCTNVPLTFRNQSLNAQSFLWDFGDGGTSTSFEPTHIYVLEGSYQVKLTAISGFGCVYSDSLIINITGPPPQPLFHISSKEGCSPFKTSILVDTSQYSKNFNYYMDFGNGQHSNSLRPTDSLIYNGSLTVDTIYYIRFVSYNSCDSLVFTDSVLVHPKPLPQFEMLHNWDCTPVEVLFKNDSRGNSDSYFWDFGDGSTSTSKNPVHTFTTGTNSKLFNINLVAFNACGTDTLTKNLLVKPNTVDAFFTVNNFKGCENDLFCFQNYSTDTSGIGIVNLSWNFGDGQSSSAEYQCHSYNQAGKYVVKLHVDNGCGHDDSYDTITINPVPELAIALNNEACVGEKLFFNYSTNVDIAGKTWYFGDGDSSSVGNASHTYLIAGSYEVMLKGISASGFPACIGVARKQVTINPTPHAFILPDTSGCAPLQIIFQGDTDSYHLWNFGDNVAFTSNATHIFDSAGLFQVTLISENIFKCRDTDSIKIRIYPNPKSDFSFTSSGGYPEYLSFINMSIGATECQWDFGNGQVLSECTVDGTIEYNYNDNYLITLLALNEYGCTDTTAKLYQVNFKGLFVPNALIPEAPDPDENLFLPKGIGIAEYNIQIFDTWGNMIWQSSALQDGMPSEGWNGRNEKGEIYPQDVYVWRITAKFADGSHWSGNNGKTYGTVTLIR